MIHHFLSQVGTKIYSNKVLEGWIVRVRKVAYCVEDITDEYSYNIALEQEKRLKWLIHKFFYSNTFHRITVELKDIEEEIKHLSQLKGTIEKCSMRDEIVGMKEDMELLGKWLYPKELDRIVISVWGFGGLGKTTLVRKVYDWEKGLKSFDCYSWITVSHNVNIDAILRQLIQEVSEDQSKVPADLDNMHHGKLNDELKEVLSNKKYLIVLDDVWDTRAFHELSDSLVDDYKRSRIIITTRNNDVASLAQEMYKMELNPLGNDDGFELFRRRCFQKSNMECPSHLEELSRQIVNKCGGLPLAINAIANVLAVQESKEIVWRRINNQFSMFPQDYIFKRELLIKLWIVEGFVIQRGQSTLEEVADGYFTELIQQSMMQLVENDEIGRVVSCRMHDTVRELALSFSRKERFGLADINLETQKKDDVCRLLVSNFDQVNQLIRSSMDLPHLRTFIAANKVANYQLLCLLISRCKYLAVLELRDSPLDKIPGNIGDLFNLRYLGLRRTSIKSLPRSIKRLCNLETLDLNSTNIKRLPREVAKLKKLRHIFAEQLYDPEEKQLRYFRGVKLPDRAFNLVQLETLQTVEATKKSVKLLKYLPELKLLCVENICRADCATLFSSLSNMNHLYDLVISANDLKEPPDFNSFNPKCTKLEKLTIRGCWDSETFRRPVFCEYGANIKYLTLTFCKNDTDPLPSIASSVPNLIFLSIRKGCWAEDIILRAGWFPQLRTLYLGKLEVKRLFIEEGAIIKLEVMLLLSLTYLKGSLKVWSFLHPSRSSMSRCNTLSSR
ncbi:disease resistance protein RPM1-like [Oryza brachyantha]|uniref:disease resistance protein RPM1-like n=1 Tax=Oryza brachyantha TaxID=4533 RepID=UPI001ADB2FB6|nr:disease resistance protein RPM1-like [Oryza brachyantha]